MQTIEQESPTLAKPRKKYQEDPEDSYFSSSSKWSEQSSRYGHVRDWPQEPVQTSAWPHLKALADKHLCAGTKAGETVEGAVLTARKMFVDTVKN